MADVELSFGNFTFCILYLIWWVSALIVGLTLSAITTFFWVNNYKKDLKKLHTIKNIHKSAVCQNGRKYL